MLASCSDDALEEIPHRDFERHEQYAPPSRACRECPLKRGGGLAHRRTSRHNPQFTRLHAIVDPLGKADPRAGDDAAWLL
jgi:hypothetical protein